MGVMQGDTHLFLVLPGLGLPAALLLPSPPHHTNLTTPPPLTPQGRQSHDLALPELEPDGEGGRVPPPLFHASGADRGKPEPFPVGPKYGGGGGGGGGAGLGMGVGMMGGGSMGGGGGGRARSGQLDAQHAGLWGDAVLLALASS